MLVAPAPQSLDPVVAHGGQARGTGYGPAVDSKPRKLRPVDDLRGRPARRRPSGLQYVALLLVGYLGTSGAGSISGALVGAMVLVVGAVFAYKAAQQAGDLLLRRPRVTTVARGVVVAAVAMVVFLAWSFVRDFLLERFFP